MRTLGWVVALALVSLSAGCNKHDVPLGGACEVQEDCATGAVLFCVQPPASATKVCASPCSMPDPRIQGSGCPAGFTCTPMNAPIAGGDTQLCMKNQ